MSLIERKFEKLSYNSDLLGANSYGRIRYDHTQIWFLTYVYLQMKVLILNNLKKTKIFGKMR